MGWDPRNGEFGPKPKLVFNLDYNNATRGKSRLAQTMISGGPAAPFHLFTGASY